MSLRQGAVRRPTLRNPTLRNPTLRNPTLRKPTLRKPTLRRPTLRHPKHTRRTIESDPKQSAIGAMPSTSLSPCRRPEPPELEAAVGTSAHKQQGGEGGGVVTIAHSSR